MPSPLSAPRATVPARFARVVLLVAAAALALLLMRPTYANADVTDLTPPPDGCLAYDVGAVAMEETSDVQTMTLDVAGPVVQVIIEWSGIWMPAPTDPTIGVEVSGPGGTDSGAFAGTESTDPTGLPTTPESIVYGYVADITDLFGAGAAGAYTVNITPPVDGIDLPEARWGGATVTAVYDSSPCDDVATVIWKTGADYYFGGNSTSSPTTDLIVYDWGYPLAEDYTASFATSQAGSDHVSTDCRVSSIWVATGAGTAPATTDDLVDDDGVPNPTLGGIEGVVSPFTPPNQTCPAPALTAPVVAFSGGNVGPEQALVQFDVLIPAGATWAAFQIESPADNGGNPGLPESGAWTGAGLLILPAFVPAVPDIALEKTVLDGTGADCPGVEGTDELVSGEPNTPVTYCFRVINTGEVALFPVELDDPDLSITGADMTLVSGDDTVPLEPGAELVYSYDSTITADLLNTATVTGYPEDGGEPVTDTNDAAVQMYVITGTVTPFCEADAPYLGYDIQTNAPGTATITFTGDGGSESVTVPVGTGEVLWPGAVVGPDGVGIDWPGWDQDASGDWFENPANPYTWARPDVQITVQVNPTTEPVTVAYPPGTPTCLTAPPPNEPPPPSAGPPPPPLADTGAGDPTGPAGLAAAMSLLGAALVVFSRRLARR
ncbi:hypothetical protein [Occultella kanbiaonis]|uniref:DUF7507 domain-containing protein n=1 Tax=Occultella kanbiaonis TaxID=2675754 RepID=UPI0013D80728|nr:hypothetical protein [Occultella kanbiaonis]